MHCRREKQISVNFCHDQRLKSVNFYAKRLPLYPIATFYDRYGRRALLQNNIKESPRTRAIRGGASRAGKAVRPRAKGELKKEQIIKYIMTELGRIGQGRGLSDGVWFSLRWVCRSYSPTQSTNIICLVGRSRGSFIFSSAQGSIMHRIFDVNR